MMSNMELDICLSEDETFIDLAARVAVVAQKHDAKILREVERGPGGEHPMFIFEGTVDALLAVASEIYEADGETSVMIDDRWYEINKRTLQ